MADEVTALCHGRAAAEAAHATAQRIFEEDGAASGLPTFPLDFARMDRGVSIVDLLATARLVGSKGEARRAVRCGVSLNGTRIADELAIVSKCDFSNGIVKLCLGRKRRVLFRIE